MDSIESHLDFMDKHGLHDLTLLSDAEGEVVSAYDTEHWLLPVSRRVFILVNRNREIVFRRDAGLGALPDQTATLIGAIDAHLP